MRVARLLLATWCTIRAKKQRPRDACEAALGVLAWRNPGIMDDWLGRSGYCPSVTHGVSVAARVDEAAPEAADDWAPCATPPRTVAVVVREPVDRFLAGVAQAAAPARRSRAWAAWRASRGRAAFDAGDAAAAYARDVAAGFRHAATQPVAAEAGGWPGHSRLGYDASECAAASSTAPGAPAAARDAPASRAEAEALLEAYRRGPVGTFARATYFCPLKAGNGVFGFLNAFALAVVTNRTLVARFASPPDFAGNSEAACGAALRLRRWVAGRRRRELVDAAREPRRCAAC
ncbi:hypothetical protein JL720_15604 [Aureococcus anophagefferens]|nr:hypothetical protein JL720_15604 [Aureococcus anophagefferens]